jgi:Undecaprenyl-phosphate glucose phosphotransferase
MDCSVTSEIIESGFSISSKMNGMHRPADGYEDMRPWERWYCDRMGQLRRPMVLFTIICIDLLLVTLTGIGAFQITTDTQAVSMTAVAMCLTIPMLVIGVLSAHWSYSISALRQPAAQIGKVCTTIASITLTANGILFLLESRALAPETALTWSVMAIVALAFARLAAARAINQFAAAGRLRRRTVIVGADNATTLLDLLSESKNQLNILGLFDDRLHVRNSDAEGPRDLHRLGTFDELESFCRDFGVELLIVNVPVVAEERLLQIVKQLLTLPVDIRISAHNSKLRLDRKAYTYIGKVPMLPILDRPLNDGDRMIKSIEDRVVGVLLLILAAPIMVLVALAVRLESKGPVLFRQKRIGFNNELIEVCKFRSMYTDMSDAAAARLVTKDDPRVTRVGRFIRKTSLDELPQLFNVLRGEMSIVGPRPHALQAKAGDDLYHDAVRSYFARHKVKPGITGWAQVNGWRGETDTLEKIEQRVAHDMHYINNWSVLFDLYITAITPFSLIGGKNAY